MIKEQIVDAVVVIVLVVVCCRFCCFCRLNCRRQLVVANVDVVVVVVAVVVLVVAVVADTFHHDPLIPNPCPFTSIPLPFLQPNSVGIVHASQMTL